MKRSLVVSALVFTAVARAAPFEFTGYTAIEGKTCITITDLADRQSSGWLTIGDSFRGYLIAAYEPKGNILILKRETETIRLQLKDSKVVGAKEKPEPAPPATHYVLKAGDTGAKIAAANGLSLTELSALNPDVNWARLRVGQNIRLRPDN